ncbi:hypothetical protein N7462_007350 [Penicillium macrosclerotiorum]|uniref:uncharacterized protein n=1 Tax=Penicillium macrosclerotiorum TaxID=303699 RepID=UPI002546A84A|nr:uncharacterized protein N7462_007350 [Penicillium macrosclerotiorum]KAJ5679106.1 hypothetical protein N7462_007350 [Penicillium macrosclerotiorum]
MKISSNYVSLSDSDNGPLGTRKDEVLPAHVLVGSSLEHVGSEELGWADSNDARTSRTGRVLKAPAAFIPAATVTSAATGKRKGPSRKKEANVVCALCGRGHSPETNTIVFCDGCNETWHQKCHDPPIPDEVIQIADMEWLCRNCGKPMPMSRQSNVDVRQDRTTRIIHPRLQPAPRLEVGGDRFSPDERRAYLSNLSHAHLVELLVNISNLNPSVSMFPANMRDKPASKFNIQQAPRPKTLETESSFSSQPLKKRSRTSSEDLSEVGPNPIVRKRSRTNSTSNAPLASTTSSPSNRSRERSATSFASRQTTPDESEPETEGDSEIDDHRLYPRAGNGFSASLDPADLNVLHESPESKTFSHSLHGPARAEAPAGIWGECPRGIPNRRYL